MTARRGLLTLLMAFPFAMVAACGDGNELAARRLPSASSAPKLVSIAILPAAVSIAAGTSARLQATAVYDNDERLDISSKVAWSSSDASTAKVKSGPVRGVKAGTATISARFGDKTATASVAVTDATLTSIVVRAPRSTLAAGTSVRFTATGAFSDNTTQPLTSLVAWRVNNASALTISNAAGSQGVAKALAPGAATVTAAFAGAQSPPASLTVTAPTLHDGERSHRNRGPSRPIALYFLPSDGS